MTVVLYVLLAFLLLSVLIVLHELGHYLVGKWLGFTIVEFSIGLGPKIFGKKGKETEFTLRALPIGGSCRFYGEDQEVKDGRCFNAQKAWKRLLVVAAGPIVNILFAVLLAFVLLLAFGTTTAGEETITRIAEVEAGSAAEKAELEVGDVLLSLNGTEIENNAMPAELLQSVRENEVELSIYRGGTFAVEETYREGDTTYTRYGLTGGEVIEVTVTDIRDPVTGNNRLGVSLQGLYVEEAYTEYNVATAFVGAFPYTWDIAKSVYEALGMLLSCEAGLSDMAGPVGTVDLMSDILASGRNVGEVLNLILVLLAMISVNLGIMNLLPLPALDGGRILFLLLEMIRKKPIAPEKEGMVHFIGMVLLLVLMLVLTVSDVLRCFGG